MIDEKVLDEILPVPALEELKDEKVAQLQEEGFVVTNFSNGGIFYHLSMICFQIRIELVKLLRRVVNQVYVTHANGTWLELKAADFSKKRKQAVKTQGFVTISREQTGAAVKLARGTIFKTLQDINGDELRFFALEDTVLQADALACNVNVEAEKEGAAYNVPAGQITKSLIHIEGIDNIENKEDWITREGADIENDTGLRRRTKGAWDELATLATAAKFRNVCEGVEGVLYVTVNDRHPRGQGTVDIIVTGTAGEATQGLLDKVREAAATVEGPYDDILVKSSETVTQDLVVTIYVSETLNTDGLEEKVARTIAEFMQITNTRDLYLLYHADIIHEVKGNFASVRNVKVIEPPDDLVLGEDKVIILGRVTVTVEKVWRHGHV